MAPYSRVDQDSGLQTDVVGGSMVVLVRHARPHLPRLGGPDEYHRDLTAEGKRQAQGLVDLLPTPTSIVSSPYLRAINTVQPLAHAVGLTVRSDAELREWDSGVSPRPDYADHFAFSWDHPGFARPDSESLAQLTVRATNSVRRLAESAGDGVVVVGSHGTFICRVLIGLGLTHIDWAFAASMPMPAVYQIQLADGAVVTADGPGL